MRKKALPRKDLEINFVFENLKRALKSLERNHLNPTTIARDITDYLTDFELNSVERSKFGESNFGHTISALENELFWQMFSESSKCAVLEMLREQQLIQNLIESEIAESNFDNCREYKNKRDEYKMRISSLADGGALVLTAQHIRNALEAQDSSGE